MSINLAGRANRIASIGTSVCPPAMTRESSSAASNAQASASDAGLTYSNEAGFIAWRFHFFDG
jgi:hypothetical protein